jgi:hypothetical protein
MTASGTINNTTIDDDTVSSFLPYSQSPMMDESMSTLFFLINRPAIAGSRTTGQYMCSYD